MERIRKEKNKVIASCLIILLPALLGIIFWNRLPEALPVHFNIHGEVDRYAGRAAVVFGLPLIMAAMQILTIYVVFTDERNADISSSMFNIVVWLLPVVSLFLFAVSVLTAMNTDMKIVRTLTILSAGAMMLLGNYLPKVRRNRTVGFRNRWTLQDSSTWDSTHRFVGRLTMIGGIITILLSLFIRNPHYVLMVYLLTTIVASYTYSYKEFKKHEK